MESERWDFICIQKITLFGHSCNHPTTIEHPQAYYTLTFMSYPKMEIRTCSERRSKIPARLLKNKKFQDAKIQFIKQSL